MHKSKRLIFSALIIGQKHIINEHVAVVAHTPGTAE
jgi:hypothetical protein